MSDITPNDLPSRVVVLEEIARGTRAALERIERRLDIMDGRIESVRSELHTGLAAVRAEHRADFRWLPGVMIAGYGTLLGFGVGALGVMAHGFHWL